MQKTFVLDTNVLLHDPEAIRKFSDNHVAIPIYVIEEIDQFKKELSDLGRNARQVSRDLDVFREQGNLGIGVPIKDGGTLRVVFTTKAPPAGLANNRMMDNLILACAIEIQEANPETPVVFVTKDTNLRVRADAIGLMAANYEAASTPIDSLYPGTLDLEVSEDQINDFYEGGCLEVPHTPGLTYDGKGDNSALRVSREVDPVAREPVESLPTLFPNEYVRLSSEKSSALGRVHMPNREIRGLPDFKKKGVWGIKPRNKEQHYALDALLDDDIKLVTLLGKAGTGKTLMALAAALQQVTDDNLYHKLLVSRPIFPMGRDIGFLPGTVEEKLNPWMKPIFDNIEFLLGLTAKDKQKGRGVEELVHLGILQVEPLTFIRGRSIPQQFMIVDEAQNLTPHEVKTILTRVGEGTKIVLTGDPYQIDNPYVDSESNGLTYVINRFRGQPMAATVTLFKGERSPLAELAANLL